MAQVSPPIPAPTMATWTPFRLEVPYSHSIVSILLKVTQDGMCLRLFESLVSSLSLDPSNFQLEPKT